MFSIGPCTICRSRSILFDYFHEVSQFHYFINLSENTWFLALVAVILQTLFPLYMLLKREKMVALFSYGDF